MSDPSNENFVNLAVPAQHYPKVLMYLADLMMESKTTEHSSKTVLADPQEWSESDIRRLWALLPPENTVGLAVLDLCASQPNVPVSYPDACQHAGMDLSQGKAHIAAFTKACNKIRNGEWPVSTGWAEDGGSYRYYVMSPTTAERWLLVRSESRLPVREGMTKMHRWTDSDNLIAYCLYRLGNNERTFGVDPKELGTILGMGYNSLNLKVGNFKAIEGMGGLDGYSKQAKQVQERYGAMSDSQLRAAGLDVVRQALDQYSNT